MTVKNKPLAEVSQRAIEVLCRELGAVDTIRFINQFTTGHGDYTSERDALFAGGTVGSDHRRHQANETRRAHLVREDPNRDMTRPKPGQLDDR